MKLVIALLMILHLKDRLKKFKRHICFKRIYVSGIYSDGNGFEGKEDHVWMHKDGFDDCKVGDCFRFTAEVYRYMKTGNGKTIDYGIRYPECIEKIESYRLPTDEELLMQAVDDLVCECCLFRDHCYLGNCIADQKWRDHMCIQFYLAMEK